MQVSGFIACCSRSGAVVRALWRMMTGGFDERVYFSNEFYKNIDLTVHTCGMEVCAPGHSYGWAVRASWMVHFVLSGKGIYRCEDREFRLKAGDLFLIIPGQRIFYQADQSDP